MRQGSFMYCEQKEHLCIFCNTAFNRILEATPHLPVNM